MKELDGYSFIKRARKYHRDLPLIVLSGMGIVDEAMRGPGILYPGP